MKKLLLLLFLLGVGFPGVQNAWAQSPGDTIEVRSFNYTQTYGINQWSPGIRDSVIPFPDLQGVTYEKILMTYNMRCKDGLVSPPVQGQTDIGCGEWDASCNTYIHDSTMADSIAATHPDYLITDFTGTFFYYTTQPTYDFYRHTQTVVTLDSILNETQYQLLSGTTPLSHALDGAQNSGKSQYLYTAAELTSAGFSAGDIHGLMVNAVNPGDINFLRVRLKSTTAAALDPAAPDLLGFTDVYFHNYPFVAGSNRIQFHTPFNWNGTDNLIVEFSFTNSTGQSTVQLEGTTTTGNMAVTSNNGYHTDLAGNGHIDVPTAGLSSIQNQITVSFWAFGDANQLPVNNSILWGTSTGGDRNLNVHLPWGNSQIYFDCGNDGSGYDRINKTATSTEIAGQWNHWAFTKNAQNGEMRIYLNGNLWHSGTGNTRPIEIANLIVGKGGSYTNNYKGSIDELRIWDATLSQTDIQNWMRIPVDNTHPNYSNLVAYYQLDEGVGSSLNDVSPNAAVATANNAATWRYSRGVDLNRSFTTASSRPSITLLQGTYNQSTATTFVLDSIQKVPNHVRQFQVISNAGSLIDDELQEISDTLLWAASPQTVWDVNTGNTVGSIAVATEGTITPNTLNYFRRWPAKFEIMSFVTPYGISLDLGPEGKTWTFDMTDYTPILKGNKRMTIERGGQWMEDMDIRFLFIVGTPPRDVLDIKQLWRAESRGYNSILSEQYFPPRSVMLDGNAAAFKVRTAISGHGQEGEFIGRQHQINIDGGSPEFTWQGWKECAENPVYPQGGTWIYDRAGWCPGMPTDVQHHYITDMVTPGQPVTIDYDLATASGNSNYIVNSQLVSYGAANHAVDAAVVEVRRPSNRVEFARNGVICHSPEVVIQNTGSDPLTSLTIKYWVNNDDTPEELNWTGSLAMLETETVLLPSSADLWDPTNPTGNVFHVEVEQPNGAADEYSFNNVYHSEFEVPPVMPNDLVIWFNTNGAGSESQFEVVDDAGNVVHTRSGMSNNTLYQDSLDLPAGCYTFRVLDSDDDGIDFWANNDGIGYVHFRERNGTTINIFEPDFGGSIEYHFTVDYPLAYEELHENIEFRVYPNPASDQVRVDLSGFSPKVDLNIINGLGQTVQQEQLVTNGGEFSTTLATDHLGAGIYFIRATDGENTSTLKLVIE